jgi:hypothetical protein
VKRRSGLVLLLASAFCASGADAQRNGRKGIPCGNTCISADKVCHVITPAVAPTPIAPSSGRTLVGTTTTADSGTPAATAGEFPWVGSLADGVYFRAYCAPAQDLAPANRRYFRMVQDAERAGFRWS